MGKTRFGRKTVQAAAVLIVFGILFSTGCLTNRRRATQTYQVVIFGDSVYGNVRDESAIPERLEELLGMTTFNAAIGGTCLGRWDTESDLDYSGDSLSVVALAKALYASDFGVQEAMRSKEEIIDYFPEMIRELEKIDFSSVELVIIGSGTNDYYNGILLENSKNPMDEHSFAGAIRRTIGYLRRSNPEIRILLVTPTSSWLVQAGQTCEQYNLSGILEEYVNKEIEVAEECGVEVLDIYHDFYPHEQWEDYTLYTLDGLHPNDDGRKMIAERIAEYLKNNL